MTALTAPLRQPTFALLWGATLLANLGFWIQDTTLSWLIGGLTTSPSQVALVPAMALFPTVLLSLPAGALGDSVDRRRLLIVMQLLLVAALLSFAAMLAAGRMTVGFILTFALISGIINAIAGPTRQSVLPSLVEKADVRAAVMLSAIGYNGSRAVGPMLGGVVLALFGPLWAVLSYTASCLMVAVVLILWRSPPRARAPLRIWPDIRAGIAYALHEPRLRGPLIVSGVYFLCIAPLWAFSPLVARGFASGDSRIFGLFMMSIGVGSVAGGFSRHLNGSTGFARSLRNGAILSALGLGAIALAQQSMAFSLLGFLLTGFGWIGVSAGINSQVLLQADAAFRTRSIALVMIVFSGGLAVGSLAWGQVGRLIGIHPAFGIATGLLILLAAATAWRVPATTGLPT